MKTRNKSRDACPVVWSRDDVILMQQLRWTIINTTTVIYSSMYSQSMVWSYRYEQGYFIGLGYELPEKFTNTLAGFGSVRLIDIDTLISISMVRLEFKRGAESHVSRIGRLLWTPRIIDDVRVDECRLVITQKLGSCCCCCCWSTADSGRRVHRRSDLRAFVVVCLFARQDTVVNYVRVVRGTTPLRNMWFIVYVQRAESNVHIKQICVLKGDVTAVWLEP